MFNAQILIVVMHCHNGAVSIFTRASLAPHVLAEAAADWVLWLTIVILLTSEHATELRALLGILGAHGHRELVEHTIVVLLLLTAVALLLFVNKARHGVDCWSIGSLTLHKLSDQLCLCVTLLVQL